MDGVIEAGVSARLKSSLVYLARRRFKIGEDVAEDLVQSALVTYLEVRHRYPRTEEHLRILVGIFRNKCREHIGRCVRTARGLDSLRSTLEAGADDVSARRESPKGDGVLHDVLRREDGRRILEALAELRAPAREMFRLITEEGLSRKDLMRLYGLNANTLDSRIHTYRKELRTILDRRGLAV